MTNKKQPTGFCNNTQDCLLQIKHLLSENITKGNDLKSLDGRIRRLEVRVYNIEKKKNASLLHN
jgi:hypothetical protein